MRHSIFALEEKPEDAPALKDDLGEVLSYGDLIRIRSALGQYCSRRGLVICLCENRIGAIAGYTGLLETGMVPLLMDAGLEAERLKAYCACFQPAYLWVPDGYDVHQICHVESVVFSCYGYQLWKTGYDFADCHEDLALLLPTSGSTGDAKMVRLSYENLVSNAKAICTYLKLTESERPITVLPMHYTYGLSIIHSHLMAGSCILVTAYSCVQSGFWDFIEREHATSMSGVPYTYQILKRMHVFDKTIPSLRTITQAGGKLPDRLQMEVASWALKQQIDFYIMYGQTEATARMSYLNPTKAGEKIGSIGKAIPGGNFSLLDEAGNIITENETEGELIYSGSNVSMGYAVRIEDLFLGDDNQGVLHTGDLAKRDKDGCYYITGRIKRFVKIFGIRVSLDACEELLHQRFSDTDLACTGTDDHLVIHAVGKDSVLEEMAAYLSDILHVNRKAVTAIARDDIPKNAAGKVLYHGLE